MSRPKTMNEILHLLNYQACQLKLFIPKEISQIIFGYQKIFKFEWDCDVCTCMLGFELHDDNTVLFCLVSK